MQNPTQSRPNLGRRTMLKLLAAAGVTVVGGYTLFEYAPWLNYDQQASQARRPFAQDAAPAAKPAQMRELVRYATLAASGHNTQPWQFAIKANMIEIHPDLTRHLPAVDPSDRELWISLGCALENLLVAARADGYAAAVDPSGTKKVAGIHAPGAAGSPERMTLTMPGILSSRRIVLLFMGQDKLAVYNEAKAGEGSSPVREMLTQHKVPVHAFWAP